MAQMIVLERGSDRGCDQMLVEAGNDMTLVRIAPDGEVFLRMIPRSERRQTRAWFTKGVNRYSHYILEV